MSNALTPVDPRRAQLAEYVRRSTAANLPTLPVLHGRESGMASTYIIARSAGGVGASMLALMLSHLLQAQPFVVQVGGLRSWAYGHLTEHDFAHFKIHEHAQAQGQLFGDPLDKRLEDHARPSLLEYDQSLAAHAIEAANLLHDSLGAHAVLCVIADANDEAFRVAEAAHANGVKSVVMFRQHRLARETRSDVIQIPTVPMKLASHLRRNPGDFHSHSSELLGMVTGIAFQKELSSMAARLVDAVS